MNKRYELQNAAFIHRVKCCLQDFQNIPYESRVGKVRVTAGLHESKLT